MKELNCEKKTIYTWNFLQIEKLFRDWNPIYVQIINATTNINYNVNFYRL
jgi:hypothetical protein